jgi:hypothetical protein
MYEAHAIYLTGHAVINYGTQSRRGGMWSRYNLFVSSGYNPMTMRSLAFLIALEFHQTRGGQFFDQI